MTGLVVLLVAGIFITGASESRQGRWAGSATIILAAAGIVGLTVARAAGVWS